MEKISGIIPSSPRISAVDLKESAPVRPGTPSFGRREGVSSLREPIPMDAPRRASAAQADMVGWKSKDLQQAAMVQEMSDKFFIKNRDIMSSSGTDSKTIANTGEPSLTSAQIAMLTQRPVLSNPTGFKAQDVTFASPMSSLESIESVEEELMPQATPAFQAFEEEDASTTSVSQPPGLYPKGSFIDFSA